MIVFQGFRNPDFDTYTPRIHTWRERELWKNCLTTGDLAGGCLGDRGALGGSEGRGVPGAGGPPQ